MFAASNDQYTVYLRLWKEQRRSDKYVDVTASTSVKDATSESGYKNDFSAIVRLIGPAKDAYDQVGPGNAIIIKRCGVTTNYDKEKNITYTNYMVFDADPAPKRNASAPTPAPTAAPVQQQAPVQQYAQPQANPFAQAPVQQSVQPQANPFAQAPAPAPAPAPVQQQYAQPQANPFAQAPAPAPAVPIQPAAADPFADPFAQAPAADPFADPFAGMPSAFDGN